jgi:hypothetical protein
VKAGVFVSALAGALLAVSCAERASSPPPTTATTSAPGSGAGAKPASIPAPPVTSQPDSKKQAPANEESLAELTKRVTARSSIPNAFQNGTPAALMPARTRFTAAQKELEAGHWKEELRSGCPPSTPFARTLATDDHGKLRAFTEEGGTDDNVVLIRYFFDEEQRLRLVFVVLGDESGGAYEWVVSVDEAGKMNACRQDVIRDGEASYPDLCKDEKRAKTWRDALLGVKAAKIIDQCPKPAK